MYAGSAVQRVHAQPGVVAEGRQAGRRERRARLYQRVVTEGLAVLFGLHAAVELPHRQYLAIGKQFFHFRKFAFVVRSRDQFLHNDNIILPSARECKRKRRGERF